MNPEKFRGKYRINTFRLKGYDYSLPGYYFVTINTKNKQEFLGRVVNGKMNLNVAGKIANRFWRDIPKHFNNVKLLEFVVMPNHVHGIIVIEECGKWLRSSNQEGIKCPVEPLQCNGSTKSTGHCNGGTKTFSGCLTGECNHFPVSDNLTEYYSKISPKPGSLSVIIRSYKFICSKKIKKTCSEFAWQTLFYEHIIKDEQSLYNIRQYIKNNPKNYC